MNCLIVDDDELSRKLTQHCVERTDFLQLAGVCENGMEALKVFREKKIDLIFLDIEMPEMSGIEFIKTFTTAPQIIIISSKKEYAAEAFDFNITDYIVKPVEYSRFLKAAVKAADIQLNIQVSAPGNDDVFIKKDSRLLKISAKDILWIEALADYVTIHCTNDVSYTVHSTMKTIEDKLGAKNFARIHRSFIIRLDKIKEIQENSVSIGTKVFPVSRNYKNNLLGKINLL